MLLQLDSINQKAWLLVRDEQRLEYIFEPRELLELCVLREAVVNDADEEDVVARRAADRFLKRCCEQKTPGDRECRVMQDAAGGAL